MRSHATVLFCAVDDFIPISGKPLTGFPEFLEGLRDLEIPCVWVTHRSRQQLEPALRKLGHAEPFIAEGGVAVYLPEDYFHLKPAKTVRLGRFICIPVAAPQFAAKEALEVLSEETGIGVVPLSSLTPRELVQNSGLSRQDADALRHRDFDELFFFAGASENDIQRFRERASALKYSLRQRGQLWSLAVNASVSTCIRELRKLFDRALHVHVVLVALATADEAGELLAACDRGLVLTDRHSQAADALLAYKPAPRILPLFARETWAEALRSIVERGS